MTAILNYLDTMPIQTPNQSLNDAFRKIKPARSEVDHFKTHLGTLLSRTNDTESEEFHKNLIIDFLKATHYADKFYINTRERTDLVIHTEASSDSKVAVLIETKKPTNKSEMCQRDKLNAKALQELLLYFLRERITHSNDEIKHLVVTNIREWFVFDANEFEKYFGPRNNKVLAKKFSDFEAGRLAGTSTDHFYSEIAKPEIEKVSDDLIYTWFDMQDYKACLKQEKSKSDVKLVRLLKLFSPEHLLKLPFINDSNSLDKSFYAELLHLIGLVEVKDGGKKIIQRKPDEERNSGSLLENTITQLDSHDKLSRIDNPERYGNTRDERYFGIALELVITWLNRILFLKLLEAQLVSYHRDDNDYTFLNQTKIRDFDDLDKLFFRVLAKKPPDRQAEVQQLFPLVPYLNSSLFEPTELEHQALFINGLEDFLKLPIIGKTVLKNDSGNRRQGDLSTLEYLFGFLDAYDFSSEGAEAIQEDNKALINASVLGLIFEKINGYKDGSFFTPGFITMHMCRDSLRRAVVHKFNEAQGWDCKNIEVDLYNKISKISIQEANTIINSLRICDPAVGSGHFLVSALNELLAIKAELEVLVDKNGKRLRGYTVTVINDELVITNDDDEDKAFFEYKPGIEKSQHVQELLFHEKEALI